MADHPTLFSAPMVRAIIREIEKPGCGKTQTRRVLKPQPPDWATFCEQPEMLNVLHQWVPSGLWRWSEEEQNPRRPLRAWPIDKDGEHYWLQPPYRRGTRLWVREAWHAQMGFDKVAPRDIPATAVVAYEASDAIRLGGKLRPSMYMPRWASRLTLYVTDVRVQRLHDISEEDALAEGAYVAKRSGRVSDDYATMAITGHWFASGRGWYADLWDRINGPGAWEDNPWVVAYTFVPRLGNIDTLPSALKEVA